jgi:putative membrane protein
MQVTQRGSCVCTPRLTMKTLTLLAALLFAPVALADSQHDAPKTTDAPKADAPRTDKTDKAAKLSASELQVVAYYQALNSMEIDLGKTAKQRGKSQAVKDYGDMLVKDHGESNDKLTALAKRTGQRIPAVKPANEVEKQEKVAAKATAAKLKQLEGEVFDREFLRVMVTDHERELAKIDSKLADVQHADLTEIVRAQKPVLQHHADRARELQKNDVQARR